MRKSRLSGLAVSLSLAVALAAAFAMPVARAAGAQAGPVLAWGANSKGEPAGVRVTAVAGGEQFSLALTSTGKVLAWGRNEFGKLGNGTTACSDVPVWVRLPRRTTVTAISAGKFHSLALTASGRVLAWGFNGFGQLGAVTSRHSAIPVLARLPAGTLAVAISAGGNHSLALTSLGRVFAWGLDDFGELCRRAGLANNPVPRLVSLPQQARASAIAGGWGDTVILTRAGEVLACGIDGAVNSAIPVRVRLGAGVRALALSQGSDAQHALAIVRAAS